VELPQGKAPIADAGFVAAKALLGLVEQASLQVHFVRVRGLAPDEDTGHGQPLRPNRPNTRGNPQRDRRQRLPGRRGIVFGRAILQARAKETDQVTGHGPIPSILMGLETLLLIEEMFPRVE
jgi:hypothetical protein